MANFTLGTMVTNFGTTATVVGFHEGTGDLILEAPGIGKWIADPAKCRPVEEVVMHTSGLLVIG